MTMCTIEHADLYLWVTLYSEHTLFTLLP